MLEVNDAVLTMFGVTRDNFRQFSTEYYASPQNGEPGIDGEAAAPPGSVCGRRAACSWPGQPAGPWMAGTFEVEGSLRIVRWHDQEVVISVVRDITERKRLETMLHQSQKLDALGQLAGGMAHDTNNMLGVILGYANLLEEKMADDPEALADLAQSARLRSVPAISSASCWPSPENRPSSPGSWISMPWWRTPSGC